MGQILSCAEAPVSAGLPSSSPKWRLAALTFLTLCLALLAGLLALGIMFFQVSNDFQKQIRNLIKNQETLQTNFSKRLQDMEDNLCLKGKKKSNNNGPSCILCPVNWQWIGGDTCFYISTEKRSWKKSQEFCSSQNSTLLMIKDTEKLKLLPPKNDGEYYWTGLWKAEGNRWHWEDGSALLPQKTDWIDLRWNGDCGYLNRIKINNYNYCTDLFFCICEKAAVKL